MDRYQCLKLFYSHGGHPSPPHITGGIDGHHPSWGVSQGHLMPPMMPPSDAKVSCFDKLVKTLDSGRSS